MSPWRTADVVFRSTEDKRRFRLNYLAAHGFEFAIALSAVVAAVTYFLHHRALADTGVGILAQHPLTDVWALLLLTGGVATIIGLWLPTPSIEVVGLCLLIPALLIDGIAVLLNRHVPSLGGSIFLLVACVALLRVRTIIGLARIGARRKAEE